MGSCGASLKKKTIAIYEPTAVQQNVLTAHIIRNYADAIAALARCIKLTPWDHSFRIHNSDKSQACVDCCSLLLQPLLHLLHIVRQKIRTRESQHV